MKKLVLIMVSVAIMAILIAFNYLLWDKQNSQEMYDELNASKKAGIDALSRDVQNLTEENRELQDKISQLEQDNLASNDKVSGLQEEILALNRQVQDRNVTIHALIPLADPLPLIESVEKWAASIDSGEYEAAYSLQQLQLMKQNKVPDLEEYSAELKNTVKEFKVNSIEFKNDGLPDSRRGSVVMKVVLDVKCVDSAKNGQYGEGLNERYLTMNYNVGSKKWTISDMSTSLS